MRRVVVGTAGHIDHGKTALVQALTGIDTDRLPEEKARGITIDLGFAELQGLDDIQIGMVDVPGHEDFVRTMVAGASGMDVVVMVIAADEGVMPQTREHLDIVRILGVPEMVVALTKSDLVEEEWLALVRDDVETLLLGTPYAEAPIVATSARRGDGVGDLLEHIRAATERTRLRGQEDVARLPVDRAFTVQGTGTVVTGTLWSGVLSVGQKARLLPGDAEMRIRSLQVHGRDVTRAVAGERTAVALAGMPRDGVARGAALVTGAAWKASWMLTVRVDVLPGAPRGIQHGQRVRVLVGTAEVLARCVPLEAAAVEVDQSGWVQIRLEAPVVARAGDRVVIRSYSPLVTLGGGSVGEPWPPKRRRLDANEKAALSAVLDDDVGAGVRAVVELAAWEGVALEEIPMRAGRSPAEVDGAFDAATGKGGMIVKGRAFSPAVCAEAGARVLKALEEGHAEEPLRPSVPLERLRAALPAWSSPILADGVLSTLRDSGALELAEGGARRPDFVPTATADQTAACEALMEAYASAGLGAPFLDDLPTEVRNRADLTQLLRHLESSDAIRPVADGLWIDAGALDAAARRVSSELGGRSALGPADFREALPVSRRHLMALLAYLDGVGVTVRQGPVRDVPRAVEH